MGYAINNITALPFGRIIGGPLKAAIEAQGLAAKATVDFIQVVGFKPQDTDPFFPDDDQQDPDMGDVRNVTFKYTIKDTAGDPQEASLTVPILTIVPIPFIRIDEMTIDFTAKIMEEMSSAHKDSHISNYSKTTKGSYSAGWWWWGRVNYGFTASYSSSHSSTNTSSNRFKTELTMNVHVRAVQDDVPGGLSRVLDILESAILDSRAGVAQGGDTSVAPG